MVEIIIIGIFVIWAFFSLKTIKQGKGRCDGNCLKCHQTSICDEYRKDNPKESR